MRAIFPKAMLGQFGKVALRRPHISDYQQWADLRGASAGFLIPWEPSWADDELSLGAYKRRLDNWGRGLAVGMMEPHFIIRLSDNALVGGININNITRGFANSASVGYWVGQDFARQGLASDGLRAVLYRAFDHLGLDRVEANCLPSNVASRGLIEKIGFHYEGRARSFLTINGQREDHLRYAILSADPIG